MRFEDYGIKVNLSGLDQQRTHCPMCTPHRRKKYLKDLSVNIKQGVWNCKHCGWSGGLKKEDIMKEYKRPAPKKLFIRDTTEGWFEKRGISSETIAKYDVISDSTYMPQTRKEEKVIAFNYYIAGELINRKYRDAHKQMKMEKDCRLVFYAPWSNEMVNASSIYITEGEIDCLSLLEIGCDYVISVPNGAPPENVDIKSVNFEYFSSLDEIFDDFEKISKIYLVMDNDRVGVRFRDEIARRIGFERCYKVEYPEGCKDPNDVLVKHGPKKLDQCIKEAKPYPINGKYDVYQLADKIEDLYLKGFTPGVNTGWVSVDRLYMPRVKEFSIVTGIPSHGKSAFLDHMMINIAKKEQWKFGVFSPENFPFERHVAKLAEIVVGKPFDQKYNNHMTYEEMEQAVAWLNDHFCFLMPDNDEFTMDEILSLGKTAILRNGINGLVIDPWNEIEHNRGQTSETDYVSKCLSKVRRFSRVNQIHTWIVAHPTKLQKDKSGNYPIPTPYDISGSAHFRNKADNCLCVHRDFDTNLTTILIQKVRFKECGQIGETGLRYNIANGRYSEA